MFKVYLIRASGEGAYGRAEAIGWNRIINEWRKRGEPKNTRKTNLDDELEFKVGCLEFSTQKDLDNVMVIFKEYRSCMTPDDAQFSDFEEADGIHLITVEEVDEINKKKEKEKNKQKEEKPSKKRSPEKEEEEEEGKEEKKSKTSK